MARKSLLPVLPPYRPMSKIETQAWTCLSEWADRSPAWQRHLPEIHEEFMLILMGRTVPSPFWKSFMKHEWKPEA